MTDRQPVTAPAAAVEAAHQAVWDVRDRGETLLSQKAAREIAAAVVAAVAGPLKAEARLDTLAEAIRRLDEGGDADTLREWFHDLRSGGAVFACPTCGDDVRKPRPRIEALDGSKGGTQ